MEVPKDNTFTPASPPVSGSLFLMAAAQMHADGYFQPKMPLGLQPPNSEDQDKLPMLKDLKAGEWGHPAELFEAYKKNGLSDEKAREHVRKSIGFDNPDMKPEEIEELMQKQPGS